MTHNKTRHKLKTRHAVQKAKNNRDKARRKLLQQRKKLEQRREQNREQSENNKTDRGSRNPTAHSTVPPQKTNAQNAARNSHSAVPSKPKYSKIPARERLYGLRLHRATSTDSGDNQPSDQDGDSALSTEMEDENG